LARNLHRTEASPISPIAEVTSFGVQMKADGRITPRTGVQTVKRDEPAEDNDDVNWPRFNLPKDWGWAGEITSCHQQQRARATETL
jgi:hypothetical protein